MRRRSARTDRTPSVVTAVVGLGILAAMLGGSLLFLSGRSGRTVRTRPSRPSGNAAHGSEGWRTSANVGELLRLAREEFQKGLEHWQAAGDLPGAPGEFTELAEARHHFAAAQDHLARAQELCPDNGEVLHLAQETNRLLSNCIKRSKAAPP